MTKKQERAGKAMYRVGRIRQLEAALKELNGAVDNLIEANGRHHTFQSFMRLMEARTKTRI